jgi:hypothetical protein
MERDRRRASRGVPRPPIAAFKLSVTVSRPGSLLFVEVGQHGQGLVGCDVGEDVEGDDVGSVVGR